ncbi:MAG: hypothetical protein A2Z72_06080 [Omnitrophica bacterium RBG_13_46_9]|nr:MAG: hypothetical protein A2Z72_06080 [Omnitrophica bacterium RBG_13_46_9]
MPTALSENPEKCFVITNLRNDYGDFLLFKRCNPDYGDLGFNRCNLFQIPVIILGRKSFDN